VAHQWHDAALRYGARVEEWSKTRTNAAYSTKKAAGGRSFLDCVTKRLIVSGGLLLGQHCLSTDCQRTRTHAALGQSRN